MKKKYKEISFELNEVFISAKYRLTTSNSLHIIMERPYIVNKVFYEEGFSSHLNQKELETIVKKKLIELYDILILIEKNKDGLLEILDRYRTFQSQLIDIELKHRKEDGRLSAEELNDIVDYLLDEYYRILITDVFGNETRETREILIKIGPSFLQNIITAVKAKRVHNLRVDESIPIECEEGGFKGVFMFRKLDGSLGYYIDISEPIKIHIPTNWDKNLSMYDLDSQLEELAINCFKEAVMVVKYVIDNREKCEELFERTRQLWDALLDIQFDKVNYRDEGWIDGYDEFRCFACERYYKMMLDKYIDEERIKNFFTNSKLAVLFNILWGLRA